MKTAMRPTSVLLPARTLAALRRESARQTLRTGRRVTASSYLRELLERALTAPRVPPAVG